MRYRSIAILLFGAALSCFSLKAQSFEECLQVAESTKSQYGETDDRYLDALSLAVQAAFAEERNEEALKYRQVHADLVKAKYGENSLEYAEDEWRLGNVSRFKGDEFTYDHYKKAQKILEAANASDSFIYFNLFWEFFWHYWDKENWLLAASNMQKYIDYAKPWVDKEWKGNSITVIELANAYYLLGLTYHSRLNNYASAIEAFKGCVSIVEENQLLNIFDGALTAYSGIWLGYELLDEYQSSVEWHLRCIAATKELKGDTSDEYLQELSSLRYCYSALDDFDSAENTSYAILSIIEQRDKSSHIECWEDSLYVKECEKLVALCDVFNKYPEVKVSGSLLANIYLKRDEENTASYLALLDKMILAFHNTGDYATEYTLFPKYEAIAKQLDLWETDSYYDYLGLKAEALTFLYKIDEFNDVIFERQTLTQKLYGQYSQQSIMQEYLAANHLMSLEKREAAKEHLGRSYALLESGKCSFNGERDSLVLLANIHALDGYILMTSDPHHAEELLTKSINESHSLGLEAYAPLDNLGLLYYSVYQDPQRAVALFLQAKEELENHGDKTSINYLTLLNNIGSCYQSLGQASLAISVYDLVQSIIESEYGKQHPAYAIVLQNKSKFYAQLSDYSAAIAYGEEARHYMGVIYGFDSERYGACSQNLGPYYQNIDRYDKAKEVLLEALEIFKKLDSQYLISCYTNLLPCYAYDNDWDTFDEYFHLGGELLLSKNLEETEIASNFWGTVGYCLFVNGSPDSKGFFLKALNINNTIGNSGSMEFLTELIYYCIASFFDNSQNEISIPVLYEAYKNLYLSNAAFFNDSERSSFVTSPKYSRVKDVLFSTRLEGTKDSTLFDYLLFSKGLLLGTSRNYAKAVYDSGNDDVINYYTQMQSLNRFINGEVSSVPESTTIEEARAQASVLERQITLYLRENGGYTDGLSYTYPDIKENLRADEVAIEFLTYHDFTDDTDYYAAMIAGAEYDMPRYVILCKKTEIDALASLSPDKLYGESSASEEAYKLIWAPLAPYLTNIKTVYFSPAGFINKMAVEHLYNGEKRFDSLYKVLRLTSTRELCSKSHQYKYSNAVLYGGLQYDEDDATMIAESRNIRGSQTTTTENFRGFDSSVTRKGWEYLPGTLEEVNQISSIISRSKVSCDVYSSEKGNEESFKALSGNNFGILHIATHGFYMTALQAERSKYFTSNPFNSQSLSGGVSPLQRAGLLLSGGNKAWRGETVPEGVEDGILTAAEIASLDLNSCDIVVLSACETGLGEITDEGVFGLQRAFKNAGVNTIIMSLWEVDDKATSLMMQSFYRNLMKGTSKRDSFTAAQNDVRKKYPDPRYWAAFIMLD